MEINEQNIEELIMLYIDAELTEEQVRALLSFIEQHPEHRLLLDSYEAVVLPQEDFVFPGKEQLLQPETSHVAFVPRRNRWAIYAGAAAVMLTIMGLYFFIERSSPDQKQPTAVIAKNNIPGPKQRTDWGQQPLSRNAASQAQNKQVNTATASQKSVVKMPVRPQVPNNPKPEEAAPKLQINPVTTQQKIKVPVTQPVHDIMPVASLAMSYEPERTGPEQLEMPQWLPIPAEKLEPLQGFVAQIDQVKEKIEAGSRAIRNTTFALRIGDRELGFNFKNHN